MNYRTSNPDHSAGLGIFAAATVAIVDRVSNRLQPTGVAFSEDAPAGITEVSSTDEQNNIDIYRTLSPGVVNIHSTSYARDFFGYVEPQEGSGSGSILDQQGHILTNYHVVEGAQKLAVSFGSQKNYAAEVVGGDPDTDLAVIKLIELPKEGLTVVPLGDSDKLVVGQKVLQLATRWFGSHVRQRDQRFAVGHWRPQQPQIEGAMRRMFA